MSAMTVTLESSSFDKRLAKLGAPLNVTHAFHTLVGLFVHRVQLRFEAAPWKKLSDRYQKDKARQHPGQPILRGTGALYQALTKPETEEIFPDHMIVGVRRSGSKEGVVGALHQGGKGVPRRTLIQAFSRSERDEWSDVITADVISQVLG